MANNTEQESYLERITYSKGYSDGLAEATKREQSDTATFKKWEVDNLMTQARMEVISNIKKWSDSRLSNYGRNDTITALRDRLAELKRQAEGGK